MSDDAPCPHARPSWKGCPHCLGINNEAPLPESTLTVTGTVGPYVVRLDDSTVGQVFFDAPDFDRDRRIRRARKARNRRRRAAKIRRGNRQ